MTGDCRDCKGWEGCIGQWYSDSEGSEQEWYSYGDIRWCPYQVFWILKHSEDFDAGRWPKPPRILECDTKSHTRIVREATFCRPKRIIGEVRARLATFADKSPWSADKARILKRDAITVEKIMYLEDDIKSVLYYVSGRDRRDTSFRIWQAVKRYRNDNKIRNQGNITKR